MCRADLPAHVHHEGGHSSNSGEHKVSLPGSILEAEQRQHGNDFRCSGKDHVRADQMTPTAVA
jgi:hypothetical protein